MQPPPRVSVIIPAYKAEGFLAETIESVLSQTLAPTEVIVVDDGSPDRCAEIAATYPGVRVIRQANAGVANARNRGMAAATGDWLTFLDADDVWEANFLETSLGLLLSQNADVCYTSRRHLQQQADGSFVLESDAAELLPPDRLGAILRIRCFFAPSSVVIRKTALDAVGGFDQHFSPSEDWELWLRLSQSGAKFVMDPAPLIRYRVHSASASFNAQRMLDAGKRVVHERVLPMLPAWKRALHGRRVSSRLEGEAALVMRDGRVPGALGMMLRSIGKHPFHDPRRYKIAAHMLLIGYPKARV